MPLILQLASLAIAFSIIHLTHGQSGGACPRSLRINPASCVMSCDPATGCPQPAGNDCLCDGGCGYSCVPKGLSCGQPRDVRNAEYKLTGTGFNDNVTYTCNEGFTVIGTVTKRCTAKGEWGGALPTCMQVCKVLQELPFGARIKYPESPNRYYQTGESITLACKEGFKQKEKGTPKWLCVSGKWTKFPFECIPTHSCKRTIRASFTRCTKECSPLDKDGCKPNEKCLCDGQCGFSCVENGLQCPIPPKPENGERYFIGRGYNDTVTYTCKENYTLTGKSAVRRCTAKKTWSDLPINCLADCPKPSHIPENAFIVNEKERYMSGERVTFKCKPGYNQEGLATTLCFLGDWNIMPFKCEKGGCGDPGLPENGAKVGLSYGVGARVFFTCKLGFNLKGSPSRRCGEDNKWTGTQPRCEIVDCGRVEAPTNGSVIGNETTFQKIMRFACDPGFEMDGNPVAICQSDGKWSSTVTCNPVNCGSLDAPAHGSVSGDSTTFTSRLVFSCDAGYIMSGSPIRTCLKNASWSGTQPRCDAVECGKLAVPRNGTRVGTLWTFPNTVRFACDEGFELSGSAVRTCQADGSWNGTLSECNAVDCGPLPVPMNGSIPGEATVYPFQREVKCDRGFILRGSRFRLCQADGSWSGRSAVCNAIDCGKPRMPDFGFVMGLGTTYTHVITYECEEGYRREGPETRRCQANGSWSGGDVRCLARDCGPISTPQNGTKIGSLTTFPNKMEFKCDKGFNLIGSSTRACQSNGTWSGKPVVCQARDCGPLQTPLNGSKSSDATTFPNTVLFHCDEGFDLIGSGARFCTSGGVWNGTLSSCKARDCGPLATPTNGTKTGSLTTFPNKVTFSCDEGFILIGSPLRSCQSSGKWSGEQVRCEALDCGFLATPMNGSKIGAKTFFPNQVLFSCDEGFELIGSARRACLSNGSWSGVSVICKAHDCGPLVSPLNGTKTGSLTTFPNIITFKCDPGFNLIGSPKRTCQSNARWSGQMVSCKARDCGPLTTPRNGSKLGSLTTFPNKVHFWCDEGFDLLGSKLRVCQANAIWSGDKVTCQARDCGPLNTPLNGTKTGSLTTFPNTVKFMCDEGFNLIGSRNRTCQSNGKWSGQQVACGARDCGPLPTPMNGTKIGSLTTFPNKVTFTCVEGFNLIGSSIRHCQSDSTWSGSQPTCKAVDCGPLAAPMNGSSVGNLTVFPNIIKFICDEGFDLLGSSVWRCSSDGKWDGITTTCKAVDCGPLVKPLNGSMMGSLTYYPNHVSFTCDKGFLLRGSEVRACQANRTWSGMNTRCEAVDCGPLAAPRNGSMSGSLTVYPNTKTFTCDRGFELLGSSLRRCTPSGLWDGTNAICRAVDCGPLSPPMNGTLSGHLTVFPNSFSFSCDEGFDLLGSSVRQCTAERRWSGTQTTCKAVDCGPLVKPLNGSMTGSLTYYPNHVFFTCDEGFLLRGSAVRACQANRTWSGARAYCEAVDCGPLSQPMNGSSVGNLTVFPNIIKFSCDEGFDLLGSSVRMCTSSGIWSGNATLCKAVDCGPLTVPVNGSSAGSLTYFPNKISFECDKGFLLDGSRVRVCQENRKWSGETTTCNAVDCGPLSIPLNGSRTGSLTIFPNVVKFSCDEGFDLLGSSVRQCTSKGQWDGNTASCKAVDCGPLPALVNGSKDGSLTFYPNKITFACDEGFLLRGSSVRRCQSNRRWSGNNTVCEAVDCGPLAAPMNGSSVGNLTVFPNIIKFSCDEGFDLLGSSVRQCTSTGKWAGSKTSCKAVDCGPLPVPLNGTRVGSLTFYPNTMTFACDEGFLIRGSVTRRCQLNRRWSGTRTTCNAVDCGPLYSPRYGSLHGNLTVFPNVITFSCDEGFDLFGSSERMCTSEARWDGTNTVCKAVDCGPLATPVNGSLAGDATTFPNIIRFTCDEGFDLLGSSARKCMPSRKWNGTLTSCKAVDCGNLTAPTNGSVTIPRTDYPNKARLKCNEGFLMKGSSLRECQANRKWSGTQTFCHAVDCGPLAAPMNGSSVGNLTVFPNIIKFSCDEGFDLLGSNVRICTSKCQWNGTKTTCKAVDCGPLPSPRNGSMEGSRTFFPNKITFRCDKGFTLKGSSTRVCQANRAWSGETTTCQAVDCGRLNAPVNGSMIGALTVYPSVISFSCDEGFDLLGSSLRKCTSEGRWDGSSTSCKAVDCGPLSAPTNGSKIGSLTYYPNKVWFKCNKGFLMRGSQVRACQANQRWNGTRTSCQAVDCGPLSPPMNGSYVGNLTVFPNIIKFSCDEGFDLLGSSIRKCTSKGKWNGSITACQAVDCGPLRAPTNGSRLGALTVFPNKMLFKCDEGFLLRGSALRVCQANRRWSGAETRCEAVDCGPLETPLNGSSAGNLTVFPNTIAFSCDEGFDLFGSPVRSCTSRGAWSGTVTSCNAVDCGPLVKPLNGSMTGSLTYYPNHVSFTCDEGFLLRGSAVRACQANRTWSGTNTRCQAVDCGPLSPPMNGSASGRFTVFPNVVKFSCDKGFNLLGSSIRKCTSKGKWNGSITTCQAVECGPLASPVNGSIQGSRTYFPNKVKVTCDEGFLLRGSDVRVCQPSGRWSGTRASCQAVDCGPLLKPMNGSMIGDLTIFPSTVHFRCQEGFNLIGSSKRNCQSNGTWSGEVTKCQAVDCGPLAAPTNGSMTGQRTVFPNHVTFNCDKGFYLIGPAKRRCLATGIWSGVDVICNAVDCGPLDTPSDGHLVGFLTVYPNSITERCNLGFFSSTGPNKRVCQPNGTWSGKPIACVPTTCKRPHIPPNSYLTTPDRDSYELEDYVYYSCKPGYLMVGAPVQICKYGNWTEANFRCAAPMCDPPAMPPHAYITFPRGKVGRYLEGDMVYFSCYNGYFLVGIPVIKCNKSWSKVEFTCNPVPCGPLPLPARGGSASSTGTTFSQRYTFTCPYEKGMRLAGSPVRVCQENGKWSGTQPRCYLLDCGDPGTPRNSLKLNTNHTFNNYVFYHCLDGHAHRGYSYRRCTVTGSWSNRNPECIACRRPLGMERHSIADHLLSASSERDSRHAAKHARLNSNSAWCSARSEFAKYLQVDFGRHVEITGIATQGHPKEYKWVNKYWLRYTMGYYWFTYRQDKAIKVFRGNENRNTVVRHELKPTIIAQKVRIYRHQEIKEFIGSTVCLRAEFYGCSFYSECLVRGASVFARWFTVHKLAIFYHGHVTHISTDTVRVMPSEHEPNFPKNKPQEFNRDIPAELVADNVPEVKDLLLATPVIALTQRDGGPVYASGSIRNAVGIWFLVELDDTERIWLKKEDIRLRKRTPMYCSLRLGAQAH
ncbi:sushi, von Willebrand factor type A, EGF and pentraxin domain-containing protein 1-like isoform X3 [Nematostella vectensis]|uniref:sushi, von Willebrand factor type A, EGF and pentraxin domain-containing protein 1-like isoform X3 n=1 Tax=Nematostella vectensis TaxID=45351 RepID=UPI0020770193|nr:sushi, von Willebrand factor type A, EGF and pentraxin domain-containing protein 1-like isoform X3 [Nematostella vectensis]